MAGMTEVERLKICVIEPLQAENEKLKEFAKFQLGMPCKITSQEVVDIAEALKGVKK